MSKVYRARRLGEHRTEITVEGVLGKSRLRHIVRHSPDGMEWGYGGSGPSDTALSILTDHFEDGAAKERVDRCYQAFKFEFICDAPRDGFEITSVQIDDWLEKMKAKL